MKLITYKELNKRLKNIAKAHAISKDIDFDTFLFDMDDIEHIFERYGEDYFIVDGELKKG